MFAIAVEEYHLDVSLFAGERPFACRGSLALRNGGDEPVERMPLFIHPELEVDSVSDPEGGEILFRSEVTQLGNALDVAGPVCAVVAGSDAYLIGHLRAPPYRPI